MKSKIMYMTSILVIVIFICCQFSGCKTGSYDGKGAYINKTIKTGKDYKIGNGGEAFWEMSIPKGTFDDKVSLSMKILSDNDGEKYHSDLFESMSPIIDISIDKQSAVRLNNAVRLTVQLSETNIPTMETIDEFLIGYWTGTYWEYIYPEIEALAKGFMVFDTFHFSEYMAIKMPKDEERIKLYVKKIAAQKYEDDEKEKLITSKVQGVFAETFTKMGISDASVQGKLVRSIVKENDFMSLIVAAERGDIVDYGAKYSEHAANAIIKQLKIDDKLLENFTGKGAAVLTGLGKAALEIKDGQYTNAVKELSLSFIGYFPVGRLYQATAEIIDAGIASFRDYEVEAAYKAYTGIAGEGAFGYKINQGDWNTLVIQMRGAMVRLQDDSKNAYCAVNNITRKQLEADRTLSIRIEEQTMSNLKKKFENRLANEKNIQKREEEYQKTIEGFMRDGLLDRGRFGFAMDMDIEQRLRSLLSIRQNILDALGGDMPVLELGQSKEENLNEAIAQWIQFGAKGREKFYDWLREKGYFKKPYVGLDGKVHYR